MPKPPNRYELVVTVYDNQTKTELAQVTTEESDDLEDIVAEFESLTDDDFEECKVDGDDDEEDDDEPGDLPRAARA